MSSDDKELMVSFFENFSDSIVKILKQNLDTDVCPKIGFKMNSVFELPDTESLKEGNVIYKIDYAVGEKSSTMAVLLSEEDLAVVADILMGGNGDKEYSGALAELETNSASKLLDKIFKSIENAFKTLYGKDLAFSANPLLLLKEMPEFVLNSEDAVFDFFVDAQLQLSEEKKIDIKLVFNLSVLNVLMIELGVFKSNSGVKKIDVSSMDIAKLADIEINITAELGKTELPIKCALELVKGSLITLDTLNGSDIRVYANGVEFAMAQVVAVEDSFGLKITKIISPEERLGQL